MSDMEDFQFQHTQGLEVERERYTRGQMMRWASKTTFSFGCRMRVELVTNQLNAVGSSSGQ